MPNHNRRRKHQPNHQQQTYKKAGQAPPQGPFLCRWIDHVHYPSTAELNALALGNTRPGNFSADHQREQKNG
jgi:hypothetical protein